MNSIRKILAIMVIAALCIGVVALAEENAAVTAHDYLGEWVDQDGTTNIDIEAREEGDGYIVNVQMDMDGGESNAYNVWAYGCVYDEETQTLKSVSRFTGTGDYEPDSEEEISEASLDYADAAFRFDDAGMLIWDDANEEVDDGMAFQHTIGWVDPDYVGPGHHFVGRWEDEHYNVLIRETMEDYQVAITTMGDDSSGSYWAYSCDYDAEADALVSNGEVAEKNDFQINESDDYSDTLAYDDGEATFTLNGEGLLVWDDKKEGAGADCVFEPVAEEEEEAGEEAAEGETQATGKVVAPMDPGYDLAALGDGIYPVCFEAAGVADGALTFSVWSQDVYDIVDISTLEVGDTINVGGAEVVIDSLERGESLLINGGLDEGGFTLWAFDEDNCWKVVMENDYNTYTEHGEVTLPLADDVTFTDGWDIEKDPETVSGVEAVTGAITGTEMDSFIYLNTTVRVEGGKIVEIVRTYMP